MPRVKSNGARSAGLSPKQRKEVKRIVETLAETKWFTQTVSGDCPVGSNVLALSNVTQGNTGITRNGDRIRLRKLQFAFSIKASAGGLFASADAYNACRLIIFRYLSSSAVQTPTKSDVLNGGFTDLTTAMYNFEQREDVDILWDSTKVVYNSPVWDGTDMDVKPGPQHVWHSGRPITITRFGKGIGGAGHNDEVIFVNNTATMYGGLYALYMSDSAFSPHPQIQFESIMEFTDS